MSANPSRGDSRAPASAQSAPQRLGNQVIESIARQEALSALLAFSELHEQIGNRRIAGISIDRDLFDTERFILDEVLQLICDRVQALTQADGIVIALAEGPNIVCRAASGTIDIARGVQLTCEPGFSQDFERILRCDDCKSDSRAQLDFARAIGARSTVLVPLRGRREQLGVLQAFSTEVLAFSDQDVRCLDLFSELVLSALKPEDQDRRVGWLSDIAEEVLQPKLPAGVSANEERGEEAGSGESEVFDESDLESAIVGSPANRSARFAEAPRTQRTFASLEAANSSRPGLGVVLTLVLVAAAFAAGTWWKMQDRSASRHARTETSKLTANAAPLPQPATNFASRDTGGVISSGSSSPAPDDLMTAPSLSTDAPSAVAENPPAAKITGVRHWSSSVGSTVVIDMGDHVPYEVHRLASPERIYFDLHGTSLAPDLEGKTLEIGDASLSRVRIGQPSAGVTRVVLDTSDGANFAVSMESSPYRLVVELRRGNETAAAKAASVSHSPITSTSTPAETESVPPKALPNMPLSTKPNQKPLAAKNSGLRIMLDAGHGGWDLGTVGRHGLLEKNLVLDVTERLGKLLRERLGSEVLFTRADDTYLPLDQRADMANQAQADLFVSVHANYSTSAAARGIETYYSNQFAAPGSKEIEQPDSGTAPKLMPVSMSVGALHDKIEHSRRLAANVQRSLYSTLASNSPDIRNRGIKDSAFVVLTGTTMPAILTEISFVSSPADEHNLQNPVYRQQIAEALYQGIAHYEQTAPHAKIAQLQSSASRQ